MLGIDRPLRNAAKVMTTIRELGERDIVLRSLCEGIDTANATGRLLDLPRAADNLGAALLIGWLPFCSAPQRLVIRCLMRCRAVVV